MVVKRQSCMVCGKEFHEELIDNGICPGCKHHNTGGAFENEADIQKRFIDNILLTTESAPNINIVKRIEVVTAEVAFGMNIFKELFSGVRDIVGGRSKAVQDTLRDSRRFALRELKQEAALVGANAVVGVSLSYVEISSGGNMILLVASGTAVTVDTDASVNLSPLSGQH